MWPKIFLILPLLAIAYSEVTVGGIDRTMSEGVKSLGYKIVYGDEDMMTVNQVVNDAEKMEGMKSKVNINEAAPPLPPRDVKCLMSTDNYCTKDMYKIKGVLIQSMKNNCAHCSDKEKEKAGRTVASLLAHDPVAWKTFLTRYALLTKFKHINPELEKTLEHKIVGAPRGIIRSKYRKIMSGAKVRVKKYVMETV